MKPFLASLGYFLSLCLFSTVGAFIDAIYLGGPWLRAYLGLFFSGLMLVLFMLGVRAIRRSAVPDLPSKAGTTPWDLLSGVLSVLIVPVALYLATTTLRASGVAPGWKVAHAIVAFGLCATAVANLRYALIRWRHAGTA
jgi:hypothetical protein